MDSACALPWPSNVTFVVAWKANEVKLKADRKKLGATTEIAHYFGILSQQLPELSHLEHVVAFEPGADALRLPPLLRRLEPVNCHVLIQGSRLISSLTDQTCNVVPCSPVRRPPLVRSRHIHVPARVSEQVPRLVEAHVGHVEEGLRLTK